MSKQAILYSISALGIGTLSYLAMDSDRRRAIKNKITKWTSQQTNKQDNISAIEKAGRPEMDNMENSKMVAEGSQFGVNYYNKIKQ
ncbi:hypothetical protein [Aquibacillus kalidii]|uniref:hypothetical protein n=1 Tax=Aquibacillus kalidii TaxID=2762597 RepID=UPI00164502EF|nr:hypothetical protein [Aquibacillus kalidii]